MSEVMSAFRVSPRYAVTGDAGVEIEVEGENLPVPREFWRSERDGSLRGEAREYVLSKPLDIPDVRKALAYLDSCYKESNTQVNESVRAGVHVHVNVQQLTIIELFSFITAYIILEDLLIKYCGEYREGNLFCLRARDAEFLLYILERCASAKEYDLLGSDILRYSSMNVCSLSRYGSLEFRAMRGTRELSLIGDWAEMLVGIRDVACKFNSPEGVLDMLNGGGPKEFIHMFLGKYADSLMDQQPFEQMLEEGATRVVPLAKSTDWSTFVQRLIGGLPFPVDIQYPDTPVEDY